MTQAPFPTGRDALFVAYMASAELSCFLRLGWTWPVNVLDLFAEFRALTNGRYLEAGDDLLGALSFCRLPTRLKEEKTKMQDLAGSTAVITDPDMRRAMLAYCQDDADCLRPLLRCMEPYLPADHWVLFRGNYQKAVAHMEAVAVPIDLELYLPLRSHWDEMEAAIAQDADRNYGVFEIDKKGVHFRQKLFGEYLQRRHMVWPRTKTGQWATDEETFRAMSHRYREIKLLGQTHVTLRKMRLKGLVVGSDGRNRVSLKPFRAATARNLPSNKEFVFGPATWIRSLIRPQPGWGVAYLDWSAAEIGIGAAQSGDLQLQRDYLDDPYLTFAKYIKYVPENATKKTHKDERDLFKIVKLATGYGQQAASLALQLGISEARAQQILDAHDRRYPVYKRWVDRVVEHAVATRSLCTTFGWPIRYADDFNENSARNYLLQANCANILQLACYLAMRKGVRICCPVHDALLIEAPLEDLEQAIFLTQAAMREASRQALRGFELKVGVERCPYPQRYVDSRGAEMWHIVMQQLQRFVGGAELEACRLAS
jgi:DNA polymerase I-like protein with 3'-5' exonuclease and polymerase domains